MKRKTKMLGAMQLLEVLGKEKVGVQDNQVLLMMSLIKIVVTVQLKV
jgi:hypothetical protein